MKIVFLEAVQDHGGARMSTIELAKRLSATKQVLIVDFYGSCPEFLEEVKKKRVAIAIASPRKEAFIISGSTNKIKNLIKAIQFIPHWFRLRAKIIRIINDFGADYVVVNNSKTLSVLLWTSKKFKVIFFARTWFIPKEITRINRFLFKTVVDKFLCVSEATRHAIYNSGLAKLEDLFVVRNAFETDRSRIRPAREKQKHDNCHRMLSAGGFLPDKGHHITMEVARILKARGFNFKLTIAGAIYKADVSKQYYAFIQSRIKEYDLSEHVHIVLNTKDVHAYFEECDVFIHPSSTEGLPRVIMEAMYHQKPVIVNPVGGVIDYVLHGYTGFLTKHNDPADFVHYIETLKQDPGLVRKVTRNAYELVTTCYTKEAQMHSMDAALS